MCFTVNVTYCDVMTTQVRGVLFYQLASTNNETNGWSKTEYTTSIPI